jgi:pseudaminic acid synthase
LDDKRKTVDSFFSVGEKFFRGMVQDIRNVEKSLGKVNYKISKKSKKSLKAKRSIYVTQDILKGQKIDKKNIRIIRPGYGLSPTYFKKILGRKVKNTLKRGDRMLLKNIKL